jgi:hypothetical protein
MMQEDIQNNFSYHKPTKESERVFEEVRERCRRLAHFINDVVPMGREQALALTKLEEAMMWANAGIARHMNQEEE